MVDLERYQSCENLPFLLTACDTSIVTISAEMKDLVAPSKLYSALAAGRLIVSTCSQNSCLNDIFDREKYGIVWSDDSQKLVKYLYQLSQNPRPTKELNLSGRKYCNQNYTLVKIAQEYLELFHFRCSRSSQK